MERTKKDGKNVIASEKVNVFYSKRSSDKLFGSVCSSRGARDGCKQLQHEELEEDEDDCRKKRCVDRYDSSESSDSGVAVLSCTDCSGSSSSDITDPGSPFSTASTHSEDSGGGANPPKMPPAQSAHHLPWPWTAEEAAPPLNDNKTAKRTLDSSPTNNNNNNNNSYKAAANKKVEAASPKMQQGKITEYFKTQVKNAMRNEFLKVKSGADRIPLINQLNNPSIIVRKDGKVGLARLAPKKIVAEAKPKKIFSPIAPRKILPAPSKLQEAANQIHSRPFTPTVTLTAVSFPPNLAYLHTKAPKPPDNIFVPQVNTIPLINRNPPCLNVIHVPIVNLNALPSRLNSLSVETAVPTVLPARPKVAVDGGCFPGAVASKQYAPVTPVAVQQCRNETTTMTEEPYRTEECQTHQGNEPQKPPDEEKCWSSSGSEPRVSGEKSPSPVDSDSGISSRGSLEISVDEPVTEQPKKSPILSQPKTIRFPPVKQQKQKDERRELRKSAPQSNDGRCKWDECAAQFDTSGALLEHLQVQHVISQSQANREQYVCLWRGCKVHGRTSCSISWLERHVLAHAGTKPFRCIVDGCGQRFNSQLMLERHVNSHFNGDGSQNASAKKSVENSNSAKLFKRNGRIIRFRRQPWSARMFDFIDTGVMEGLQHRLLMMTHARTLGRTGCAGDIVTLQSRIVARRTDSKGNKHLLVSWHPPDVASDEWIPEKEYKPTKTVPIPRLSPGSREALQPALFPRECRPGGERKHRRKPLKKSSS